MATQTSTKNWKMVIVAETTAAAIAPNLTRQPEPRHRTQKKSYDCAEDSVHGCKYGGDS